jgi:hypothetical protein
MHEGHWKVVGNPNGRLDFFDRDGTHIATSEPRPRVELIPTKQGRQRTHLERLTRARLNALARAA